MIAYSFKVDRNKVAIEDSQNNKVMTSDWQELCDFLVTTGDSIGVVYNLYQFAEALIKLLPDDMAKQLQGGKRVVTDDTRLFYIEGKLLGINRRKLTLIKGNIYHEDKHEVTIYDLAKYFPLAPLTAMEALQQGQQLQACFNSLGLDSERLTSPIAAFSKVLDSLRFAKFYDIPDEADEITAWSVDHTKEWREVFKIGHFDSPSDYDISGCYPSIVAQLPDLLGAEFIHTEDYIPGGVFWGIMKGKITVTSLISPYTFVSVDGNIYPKGDWQGYMTTGEVTLMRKYGLGNFKMESGWFIKPKPRASQPFEHLMKRLFESRIAADDLKARVLKAISVAIWGKFCEVKGNGDTGDYYQPVYSCMTTSHARIKVADFIYRNHLENDLIAVLVDGCLVNKDLPVSSERIFGKWRKNTPSPALVLSELYEWHHDLKPNLMKYPEVMSLIKQYPNRNFIGDIDFNLLNYNRVFEKRPKNCNQLLNNVYDSQPIVISKAGKVGKL